jgi:simple sugar transport system substrate-binding protein
MRKLLTTFGVALALAAAAWTGAAEAKNLKVGFVYVGPIGDHGWTYQHDQGRVKMAKHFAGKVDTTYVESVSEGADAERVIRQLAASGHDVIYTTSFGYMNATNKIAKMYPKIIFEHATGYKRAKNVGTYLSVTYEGRYISGFVGASMAKSGKVGYIASFPIPEVIRDINAVMLGMQRVNPKAELKVVWVSSIPTARRRCRRPMHAASSPSARRPTCRISDPSRTSTRWSTTGPSTTSARCSRSSTAPGSRATTGAA